MSQASATQLHTHPLSSYTTFLCLCCSLWPSPCFLNTTQNLCWTQNYTFHRGFFHGITLRPYKQPWVYLSVTSWGEGVVSPPRYRCGTQTGVLKACTAWRRQSREGRHSSFQSQECNTDLSDSNKVSTGFRYTFEHSACLKIYFHMEKKQNIQYINYHITNLCCIHV